MNLFSAAASAVQFVGKKAKDAGKKLVAVAQRELKGELGRVADSATLVRNAVTEASERSRNAAADAIAKAAAGIGIKTAARVGTPGNVYERASAFLDLSPEKRTLVIWALIVLAAVAIFYLRGKR